MASVQIKTKKKEKKKMEVVNTLDIDGSQWEIQDVEARNKIATLENNNITQGLNDIKIDLNKGYTADNAALSNVYKVGKIYFVTIEIMNISGNYIGTTGSAYIGRINILPKKNTSFILNDYLNNAILRCFLREDGTISIGESTGVVQGNNACIGELIFAEA